MPQGAERGTDHAIGRSRGGSSTRINAVEDEAGLPIRLSFSPDKATDKAAAPVNRPISNLGQGNLCTKLDFPTASP
ncbi:MAG: hypothetical protein CR964_01135 [Rhodobacterales bacterium]|nr:MAG: hypothetical protein CR964_01135 [Rhodobacterales bacterium]